MQNISLIKLIKIVWFEPIPKGCTKNNKILKNKENKHDSQF